MGKTTRKPAAPRKSKYTPLARHSDTLIHLVKTRLIAKTPRGDPCSPRADRIQEIVDQEVLTCSVCLQLLLSPVLAQCGHSFCLSCSEDLAKNGFACGICHSHEPAYDLPYSSTIEALLQRHLSNCDEEKCQDYFIRKASMERKEQERLLGEIQEGQLVDFWSEDELAWKTGEVTQKSKNGTLSITPRRSIADIRAHKKEPASVTLHQTSRLLAPHRYFSKDEFAEVPEQNFRPTFQLFPGGSMEPVRMPMEERPSVFSLPMFLGSMGMGMRYYWRGPQDMLNPMGNDVFEGLQPFF